MAKLESMARNVKGKSKELIEKIMEMIKHFLAVLKQWTVRAGTRAQELKETTAVKVKASVRQLHDSASEVGTAVKKGTERVAGDCKEGVEKLTQKFKT